MNSNLSKITKNNDANLLDPYIAITFPSSAGTNYKDGNSYRKIGTRVILHLSISGASTSGKNSIYTLPSGYRPANTASFIVTDGTATGAASVNIDTGGNVTGYTGSGYIIGEIEFEAHS